MKIWSGTLRRHIGLAFRDRILFHNRQKKIKAQSETSIKQQLAEKFRMTQHEIPKRARRKRHETKN
jgi:23S rRNA maturation mini-RNase III